MTHKYRINSIETNAVPIASKPSAVSGYSANGAIASQAYSQMTSTNYANANSEGVSRPGNHVSVSCNSS